MRNRSRRCSSAQELGIIRKRTRTALSAVIVAVALAAWTSAGAQVQIDREFQECQNCPMMVGIPAGSFVMGSPADEQGRFDTEGPLHDVSVKAFALGKYDVTSREFLVFLQDTGYQPAPCDKLQNMAWRSPGRGLAYPPYVGEPPRWPAVCLSWSDAQAYVAWLNEKVRRERPGIVSGAGPYRLPSEAEWEYAARGDTVSARWWGDALGVGKANCNGCGSVFDYRYLADVDSFAPNGFGLYGMLGNAWQWTADCWHESYVGAPADGSAWMDGICVKHVIRGGSWSNLPIFVRSAARSGSGAEGEYDYSSLAGFRIARTLP
jgi:formylglycine-generating enzyme required for sulfatase activity